MISLPIINHFFFLWIFRPGSHKQRLKINYSNTYIWGYNSNEGKENQTLLQQLDLKLMSVLWSCILTFLLLANLLLFDPIHFLNFSLFLIVQFTQSWAWLCDDTRHLCCTETPSGCRLPYQKRFGNGKRLETPGNLPETLLKKRKRFMLTGNTRCWARNVWEAFLGLWNARCWAVSDNNNTRVKKIYVTRGAASKGRGGAADPPKFFLRCRGI